MVVDSSCICITDFVILCAGQDWEHAHIEVARIASEALGESAMAGQAGGGPRTMRPVNKPYASAAGYPPAAYGYPPAAGYPPPAGYGYPPAGYQYGY